MNKKILIIVVGVVLGLGFWLYQKNSNPPIKNISLNDSTDFYTIRAEYPEDKMDKDRLMEQMAKYLVDQKKEEWKVGGAVYEAEQKITKDFPDRAKIKYELYISYATTTSNKFSTRSYLFQVYQFTGGAHGGTAITTYNFNKKGLIKIEDMIDFGNGNYIQLAKLLKAKLLEKLGENGNERMINDGLGLTYLKPDNTIDKEKCNCEGYYFPYNVQYFTIGDEGLKFIFSQYQVGAYALGMPEIVLTWDELKPFINKDNPIGLSK